MYREKIAKLAPGYDPAHVEGVMLTLCPGVLDALSNKRFEALAKRAGAYIKRMGLDWADGVAQANGLRPKKRKKEVKIFPRGCVGAIIEIKPKKRKATT